MRVPFVVLMLALPALAGCFAAQVDDPVTSASVSLGSLTVPAGAALVEETGKAILRFAGVALPFETEVTIPAGATIVRAVATLADDVGVSASMSNAETGRRRCNTDMVDAWDRPILKVSQCSGLAAIDPPGAVWVVRASSAAALTGSIDIVFETTPLDGIVGQLDLTQLSMPTYDLQETQYLEVPSFDGTPLWVEITLPVGEGPWPTVIAASPYNTQYGRGETPAMWAYFTHDWAKRGYAIVNVDVRGFGMSGGCVEVWGDNEQKDQAFIVDWVAKQEWSDGAVGFYGQSYVATTPVEAAVQNPEALKAIIAVAPVINAYFDWHFGGVPNGESTGSPVAYQVLTDVPPQDPEGLMSVDPATLIPNKVKGICDPTLVVKANDPRAVYDDFYATRNFSTRASGIKAAVLFTQGFEDSNVKSRMIPEWFNALTAPKLGLFGHWVHQHPTRADEEILFLGWMDQYVKGRPLGLDKVEPVHVVIDDDTYRTAAVWPDDDAPVVALPVDAFLGDFVLSPTLASSVLTPIEITEDIAVSGIPRIAITGTLKPAGNAHFYAVLYDEGPDGMALMSYGAFNLAHRDGNDKWTPSAPLESTSFELPFLPTEHVFRAGHKLYVGIVAASADNVAPEGTSQPGVYTIESATLLLPTVDVTTYVATPATALR